MKKKKNELTEEQLIYHDRLMLSGCTYGIPLSQLLKGIKEDKENE